MGVTKNWVALMKVMIYLCSEVGKEKGIRMFSHSHHDHAPCPDPHPCPLGLGKNQSSIRGHLLSPYNMASLRKKMTEFGPDLEPSLVLPLFYEYGCLRRCLHFPVGAGDDLAQKAV